MKKADGAGVNSAVKADRQTTDPYRGLSVVSTLFLVLTLPVLLGAIVMMVPLPGKLPNPWSETAARLGVTPVSLEFGEGTFKSTCALCHGPDARGVPYLGKPLRNSAFVQGSTDEQLVAMIVRGRSVSDPANTTGVPMLPRAGKPDLTDSRIADVVNYIRSLQDSGEPTASLDNWIKPAAPAGGASPTGPEAELFVASCSACHGADGAGLPGLGKSLRDSEWVRSKSDEEMLKFVKQGRPIWDAENTTGIDMPSKGGNPALTDEQIADIIKHIRELQKSAQ